MIAKFITVAAFVGATLVSGATASAGPADEVARDLPPPPPPPPSVVIDGLSPDPTPRVHAAFVGCKGILGCAILEALCAGNDGYYTSQPAWDTLDGQVRGNCTYDEFAGVA